MANQQYPITPPPKLVQQWFGEHYGTVCGAVGEATSYVATQAAQWGADQQLEACDEWLVKYGFGLSGLTSFRAAMRPSPKEEALRVLENLIETGRMNVPEYQALRQALEALPNG